MRRRRFSKTFQITWDDSRGVEDCSGSGVVTTSVLSEVGRRYYLQASVSWSLLPWSTFVSSSFTCRDVSKRYLLLLIASSDVKLPFWSGSLIPTSWRTTTSCSLAKGFRFLSLWFRNPQNDWRVNTNVCDCQLFTPTGRHRFGFGRLVLVSSSAHIIILWGWRKYPTSFVELHVLPEISGCSKEHEHTADRDIEHGSQQA